MHAFFADTEAISPREIVYILLKLIIVCHLSYANYTSFIVFPLSYTYSVYSLSSLLYIFCI